MTMKVRNICIPSPHPCGDNLEFRAGSGSRRVIAANATVRDHPETGWYQEEVAMDFERVVEALIASTWDDEFHDEIRNLEEYLRDVYASRLRSLGYSELGS